MNDDCWCAIQEFRKFRWLLLWTAICIGITFRFLPNQLFSSSFQSYSSHEHQIGSKMLKPLLQHCAAVEQVDGFVVVVVRTNNIVVDMNTKQKKNIFMLTIHTEQGCL